MGEGCFKPCRPVSCVLCSVGRGQPVPVRAAILAKNVRGLQGPDVFLLTWKFARDRPSPYGIASGFGFGVKVREGQALTLQKKRGEWKSEIILKKLHFTLKMPIGLCYTINRGPTQVHSPVDTPLSGACQTA